MLGFDCWLRMPLLVCAELSHNMRLSSGVADCFRVHLARRRGGARLWLSL